MKKVHSSYFVLIIVVNDMTVHTDLPVCTCRSRTVRFSHCQIVQVVPNIMLINTEQISFDHKPQDYETVAKKTCC